MSNSLTTADIDSQIARLEEKLNKLFEKIQQAQSITVEASTKSTLDGSSNENFTRKSRKEILAEYEKEYLARLEAQKRAEKEIQRVSIEEETQAMKSTIRGALPKGFSN